MLLEVSRMLRVVVNYFSMFVVFLILFFTFFIQLYIRNSNLVVLFLLPVPTYNTDQDNTSLFVAIAVPLILICILFVTLIFLRRRRFLCKRATDARANDNMSLPDSTMETSRPVLIKNFAEHYRIMSADSDFRFVYLGLLLLKFLYYHSFQS